jgi:hypothetical protein
MQAGADAFDYRALFPIRRTMHLIIGTDDSALGDRWHRTSLGGPAARAQVSVPIATTLAGMLIDLRRSA